MLNITRTHLDTEEFRSLSKNGQVYLRALLDLVEMAERDGGAQTAPLARARDAVDAARATMTGEEAQEVSSYAHRQDYPELYE